MDNPTPPPVAPTPTEGLDPLSAETEGQETSAPPESADSAPPEGLTPTQPQPDTTQAAPTDTDDGTTTAPTAPTQKDLNVTDSSDDPLTLHELKSVQELTREADQEEEEFIEKVEAAHDSSQ